ncbi:transcriptional regulatory protein CutR [Streptomyces spinoverrucosus]|uniref:Transcriptional regulatory protein CutR n=1 Tax=Streptomyces spinoverrucosus TaxID=284043 RepID=A0A4Y3VXS4_9ACTN|nr:response regulator transcription factor [Streptomyces spinoverrucosus]GEC09816.1 transcriptional regulatory protein CutR [Streptomyces spinoverrucosus]GHB96950.1 transcriptional regulatory protein CutR [Streptomyces spinoverrucosus]
MRVLLVEDEPYLAEAVAAGLRRESIAVDLAMDGEAALERLAVHTYDVVVLDRDLPRKHGDDVCRQMQKETRACRVLMLTAAGSLRDKLTGFEAGADDYLAKPFDFPELVARIRALQRRAATPTPPVLERAGLRVDAFRHEAYRDGRLLRLTRKEFAVLEILMHAEGGVISAEQLLEKAWDEHADPFTNAVRITVSTLRRKLGEPPLVHTMTGVGYYLAEPR